MNVPVGTLDGLIADGLTRVRGRPRASARLAAASFASAAVPPARPDDFGQRLPVSCCVRNATACTYYPHRDHIMGQAGQLLAGTGDKSRQPGRPPCRKPPRALGRRSAGARADRHQGYRLAGPVARRDFGGLDLIRRPALRAPRAARHPPRAASAAAGIAGGSAGGSAAARRVLRLLAHATITASPSAPAGGRVTTAGSW